MGEEMAGLVGLRKKMQVVLGKAIATMDEINREIEKARHDPNPRRLNFATEGPVFAMMARNLTTGIQKTQEALTGRLNENGRGCQMEPTMQEKARCKEIVSGLMFRVTEEKLSLEEALGTAFLLGMEYGRGKAYADLTRKESAPMEDENQ